MQYIANGPDVDLDVIKAHEEGELVLICGAGISVPAGLPLFDKLVEKVRDRLGAQFDDIEQEEFNKKNYDRVLGLLEREEEGRFSPAQVRRAVYKELTPSSNPYLETHKAILDLARDHAGKLRLVTTNFDLLFEMVNKTVRTNPAPLLPVPKPDRWTSLVYLHGRLDNDNDLDGRHLVLTSSDFGVAYLVDRWASRFVSELFRHFHVLFIGYSVEDPVMRYLMDALAAERRSGARFKEAYALADYGEKGTEEEIKNRWKAKNINPIPYNDAEKHVALHDTLREWAGIWRGGLDSKLSIVSELGPKNPDFLSPEDVNKLWWAVSDSSGAIARKFADLGGDAHHAWLPIFEREGVLRPHLVGHSPKQTPMLDAVTQALGVWLTSHMDKREVLRWVLNSGGHLHPQFVFALRREMRQQKDLHAPYQKVWRVLTGSGYICGPDELWLDLHGRIESDDWSPTFRLDLLTALSPCLKLRPSAIDEGKDITNVRDLVWSDCETLLLGHTQYIVDKLRKRPDWEEVLKEIAFDLVGLLHKAMQLQQAIDAANEDYDVSFIQHPSIVPSSMNHQFQGWTTLIDLVREALDVLIYQEPPRAWLLAEVCGAIPFLIFRRLALYAFERLLGTPSANATTVLDLLLSDPIRWIWTSYGRLELLRLLPSLWRTLDDKDRRRLTDVIVEGPPRAMYRDDLEPDEWEYLRDHGTWRRLAELHQAQPQLSGKALEMLRSLEESYPDWQLTGEEKEGLHFESGWGPKTDYSAESMLRLDNPALMDLLTEPGLKGEGRLYEWKRAVMSDTARAISLLSTQDFNAEVWKSTLRGFREAFAEATEKVALRASLIGLFEQLSGEQISSVLIPLVHLVEVVANGIDASQRSRLLVFWDRALPLAIAIPPASYDDKVSAAINHPVGDVAQALFYILRSYPLEHEKGIDEGIRNRLEHLLDLSDGSGEHARVIVASRLSLLHYLSPGWTEEKVVPLFNWDAPEEAIGAWQGYLWSPRMPPSLWTVMKSFFLATFDHLEEIGESVGTFAQLFTAVAIEITDALTETEARVCLRKVDESQRADVARYLVRSLEDAEERAKILWKERIGPWIDAAWPKEPSLRGSRSSELLAQAAILSGGSFSDAVTSVTPFLVPIEHGHYILDKLTEAGHIESYPEASLELVNALVAEDPNPWFGPLKEFLSRIEQANPSLGNNSRFSRLKTIVIKKGLR